MLAEIEFDVLRFFGRTALEGLQMHSRYLRDLVNRNACTLPLRYIHKVETVYGDVDIQLLEDEDDEVTIEAQDEQRLQRLFHCVNNAFIFRVELSFDRDSLPLLYHLREKANKLQCQIRALRIDDTSEAIDYVLVDFLGLYLKPQVYETVIDDPCEDYATLFAHNALRGSVEHLVYECDEIAVPTCIIPELFRVGVVESCAIETEVDPRSWIRSFIEAFERAEREVQIIRSVALLFKRYGHDQPLSEGAELLGRPLRTDLPTPQCALVKKWLLEDMDEESTTESPVAELFVFENANLAKKFELFVWTIEDEGETEWHYAFLLQVEDM